MKILLVEDDQEKRRIISEVICSVPGVSSENITYVFDVFNAKQKISQTRFDLVILDINLPTRPESNIEVGAGLQILSFIKLSNKAQRPAYVYGLTAHDDAVEAAQDEFSSPLWKLGRFSHTDTNWHSPLKEAINYLFQSNNPPFMTDGNSFHIDIGIFVALEDVELNSILALDCGWQPIKVRHDSARYFRGTFTGPSGSLSVVVTAAPTMGMPAAAVTVSKLISSFRPRLVAITGICAGVRGKANIGDILVADPCFDWGAGKWKRNASSGLREFIPAAYQWRLDEELRVAIRSIGDQPYILKTIHQSFLGDKPPHPPQVLIDAMASGASVLQDATNVEEIRLQHKNLVGIEMESYAVFTAVEYASAPKPKCISIKSVCDFADEQKSDISHEYAAHTSAQFLYHLAVGKLFIDSES